jgi:GT2 family glycosyltransferase
LSSTDGDPLYPYAAGRFGSGANTALLRSAARELGGFDPDLSAGTMAAGGEDLDLYIRLLRSGRRLTYQPAAIVWHRHHAEFSALTRQLFHYGTGLSAALTKQLVLEPRRADLLRRVPRGAARLLRADSSKNARKSCSYPRVLTYAERLGFTLGPAAYLFTAASRRLGF